MSSLDDDHYVAESSDMRAPEAQPQSQISSPA